MCITAQSKRGLEIRKYREDASQIGKRRKSSTVRVKHQHRSAFITFWATRRHHGNINKSKSSTGKSDNLLQLGIVGQLHLNYCLVSAAPRARAVQGGKWRNVVTRSPSASCQ